MAKRIELLDFKTKVLSLFDSDVEGLGTALMNAVMSNDTDTFDGFCNLVDGDLTEDWMQKIYQYYLADREGRKQDYTPKSLAVFMEMLTGGVNTIIDLCAGSGALTIQNWVRNPNAKYVLYEIDETVIPYLLFNMAVRNIDCTVIRSDVLADEVFDKWRVTKGTKYGNVCNIKSAV